MLTESQSPGTTAATRKKARQHHSIPSIYAAAADNQKSRPSAKTINNERETRQTTRTRPSATAIDEEREHNTPDHTVGNKIRTRHQEPGRRTRPRKQGTAHVTSTKNNEQTTQWRERQADHRATKRRQKQTQSSPNKKRKINVCDFRRIQ